MRMLNYSRETNPFHKSRLDVPCVTQATFPSKNVPRTHGFQYRYWMKERAEKDTHLNCNDVMNPIRADRVAVVKPSSSSSKFGNKNSKKTRMELRLQQSRPPTTVEFASIEDMDFMDSSTLSDEVCSVLTNRSKENPFQPRKIDMSNSHTSKMTFLSNHPKRFMASEVENRGKSISETEVATKRQMSGGITLMEALNRRRDIVDGEEKVVVEHLQRPYQSFKAKIPKKVPLGNARSDFLLSTRNKLKKLRRNPSQEMRRSKETTTAKDQICASQNIPTLNYDDNYVSKSSNATTTTISTKFSKSSRTYETSKHSEGQTSIVSATDMNSSTMLLNETRKLEMPSESADRTIDGTQDDRNDVEEALPSDEDRQSLDGQDVTHDPAKYNRMLKMGIPLGAVQNAMRRDLVDPSKVQLDVSMLPSKSPNNSPSDTSFVDSKAPITTPTTTSSYLTKNTQSTISNDKYAKMLKLGIPCAAVENAIQRDGGVAPSEMFKNAINTSPTMTIKKQRDSYRRTRLHWNTLSQTQLSEKSIWNAIQQDNDVVNIRIDETEFKALFQVKEAPRKRSMCKETVGVNAVKVIDPKRANNGGITLARLKLSYEDIAKAVNAMDVSNLNAQQLLGIMEFLPSAIECRSLQEYVKEKSIDILCECEKFMLSMSQVSDAQKKTKTMLFMLQFPGAIDEIKSEIEIKSKACDELTSSLRLRKILGIILKVGNRLNRAGVDETSQANPSSPKTTTTTLDANGFSLESLSKLNRVKACDKQTTILYYISSLIQRSNQSLLKVKDDLPHLFKAHSISFDHDKALINLENQLQSARSTLSMNATKESGKVTIDKDIVDVVIDDDDNNDNDDNTDGGSRSIHDVDTFIDEANQLLVETQRDNEEAKLKFMHTLEYFALDKDVSPNALFGVVASFCKEIEVIHIELSSSKGKRVWSRKVASKE